jgi:hypothetical protein
VEVEKWSIFIYIVGKIVVVRDAAAAAPPPPPP